MSYRRTRDRKLWSFMALGVVSSLVTDITGIESSGQRESNDTVSQQENYIDPVYLSRFSAPTTDRSGDNFYTSGDNNGFSRQIYAQPAENNNNNFYTSSKPSYIKDITAINRNFLRPKLHTINYQQSNTLQAPNRKPQSQPTSRFIPEIIVGRTHRQQPWRTQVSPNMSYQSQRTDAGDGYNPNNWTSLLDSGQVLVSKKIRTSSGDKDKQLETLNQRQLGEMLQHFRPLTASDSGHEENQEEEEDPLIQRILTADRQLFDNDDIHNRVITQPGNASLQVLGDIRPQPSASDEDIRFLRSLVTLNDPRVPTGPVGMENKLDQLSEAPVGDTDHRMHPYQGMATSKDNEDKYRQQDTDGQYKDTRKQPLVAQIPVDQLVDHLMSNSRLATFGVQHEGLAVPSLGSDDEDEEEAEEDEDNNDADGDGSDNANNEDDDEDAEGDNAEESEGQEDPDGQETSADESAPLGVFKKVSSANKGLVNFDSVMNKSNSWVPLDPLDLASEKSLSSSDEKKSKPKKTGGKRGKSRKRNKKGKKKKKRRRRRKKRSKPFGLVIGNRMLDRKDLVKLIGILNKMASNSKPSKEREASRKLLRFLVKLMLDEYKRNKKPADAGEGAKKSLYIRDPIRDLLRSVLMGPVDTSSDPKKDGTDGSIKLHPLSDDGRTKNDTTSTKTKEGDRVSTKDDDIEPIKEGGIAKKKIEDAGRENQRKVDDTEKNFDESRKVKQVGLGGLSDELEHYFDSDFFEDLADKRNFGADNHNQSNQSPVSTGNQKIELILPHNYTIPQNVGYQLPVPIYGERYSANESDDIDPDLDQDKNTVVNRQNNSKRRSKKRRQVTKRRRRVSPQVNKPDRKIKRRKRKQQVVESEEDHEPESSIENRDQQSPRVVQEADDQDDETADDDPSKPAQVEDSAPRDPDEDEDEEEGDQEEASEDDANSPTKPRKKKKKKNRARGRRKKRVKPQAHVDDPPSEEPLSPGKSRRADGREKMVDDSEVDEQKNKKRKRRRKFESRYEIPAPIAKGPIPPTITSASAVKLEQKEKTMNKTEKATAPESRIEKVAEPTKIAPAKVKKADDKSKKKRSKSKKAIKAKQVNAVDNGASKANDTKVTNSHRKRRNNAPVKSKVIRKKKPRKLKSANGIDELNENIKDEDSDYYNEGTSYSKICNDDDDCTVKVKSSSPQLRKAIENRNETSVVRHLDDWANEKPD